MKSTSSLGGPVIMTPPDLNELRTRILTGQSYTRDELKAALTALRTVRTESGEKSLAKRTAKAAAALPMSDEDLDASLAQFGLEL